MEYEKIKTVEEITDLEDFNAYLAAGWVCIEYCKVSVPGNDPTCLDTEIRYHVGWTQEGEPKRPERPNIPDVDYF